MQIQSQFRSNRHKEVILLVDNRKDKQTFHKVKHIDFRNSAFKQTEVDPLQPRPDISYLNEEDTIIQNLKKKVSELEKRVFSLEQQNNKEMSNSKVAEDQKKKTRRRFSELARNFNCPHAECAKIYGSETSLKNHIKLKHSQLKAQN